MRKNCQIHIWVETELFNKLKEQSEKDNLSFGEVIRYKLRSHSKLDRIENMLEKLLKRGDL